MVEDDIFAAVHNVEDTEVRCGEADGIRDGMVIGIHEGRELGLQKGYEIDIQVLRLDFILDVYLCGGPFTPDRPVAIQVCEAVPIEKLQSLHIDPQQCHSRESPTGHSSSETTPGASANTADASEQQPQQSANPVTTGKEIEASSQPADNIAEQPSSATPDVADEDGLITARVDKALTGLEQLLSSFPLNDPQNDDLHDLLERIRGRFKVVASMMGLLQDYMPREPDRPSNTSPSVSPGKGPARPAGDLSF